MLVFSRMVAAAPGSLGSRPGHALSPAKRGPSDPATSSGDRLPWYWYVAMALAGGPASRCHMTLPPASPPPLAPPRPPSSCLNPPLQSGLRRHRPEVLDQAGDSACPAGLMAGAHSRAACPLVCSYLYGGSG